MRSIIPEISVENCKIALEYYKEIFGGELKNVQTGSASPMFKGYEDKIIHSELHITDNCVLYFNDILNEDYQDTNVHLMLDLESEEEINKLYSTLSQSGSIVFELQKTFWGAYHGVVTDRYGITWGLNFAAK